MQKLNEKDVSLKTRLVEVAAAALAKSRPVKLPTMRELAFGAGVTPGAAYRHFASQEELYLSVILYLFTQMERSLLEAMQGLDSQNEKVAAMAHAYVKWGTSNPGAYQLILETTDDAVVLQSGQRAGLHLLNFLASLLSKSGLPTQESTIQATQLWTSLHGIVSLRNHKIGMPWMHTSEQQVGELLKTLG